MSVTPDIERLHPKIDFDSLTGTLYIRILPTELHATHNRWMTIEFGRMLNRNFLTMDEFEALDTLGGLHSGLSPLRAFKNQSKLLDHSEFLEFLRYGTPYRSRLVIESGWSESLAQLRQDRNVWLNGGRPEVQIVILINWKKVTAGVKGTVEVYVQGSSQPLQEETIFPEPAGTPAQTITVTRGDIFGASIFPGRNAADQWQLDISLLRQLAKEKLTKMELDPAS
ncbi:hypothetical protein V8E54_003129 [Elaphomyces granulatus]